MSKRALITGITGQDGAYLTRLLLSKGYEVYGAYRRSSSLNPWRLDELQVADQVQMVSLEVLEFTNILKVIEAVRPDEVYHFAAQSFVGLSFEQPVYTSEVTALGTARLLEAIRLINPQIRFYQASTSEMFGKAVETPQTERTPFYPRSPYAIAKLYAHWMTVNYREAYGIHASCGILFNHESPLRGLEFVTRKITAALARIRYGQQPMLELGNLEARRDWGSAEEYVEGIWRMVQQPQADTYLLASGENHSIREFAEKAAQVAGFELEWRGEGIHTQGIDRQTGRLLIRIQPQFYRPAEVDALVGNAQKARQELDWYPRRSFDQLVEGIAKVDLDRAARGVLRF